MKVYPNVPVVYKDKFPKGFVNQVNGWGSFSKERLRRDFGKLLTLDIDFGDHCTLKCPHCFRRNNAADKGAGRTLNYEEIADIVKQGKDLGLISVKFLGKGEPFEDEQFLEFLRDLKKLEVVPSIFTKGHIIGDDEEVKRRFSKYGISTSRELIEELKKVDASILLGFNSFDTDIQDRMVGNVKGYTQKRNRALELLVEADFNKHNPTHLCLAANPITNENADEMVEIYKWGRERNLHVVITPPMVSGACSKDSAWKRITPPLEKLVEIYTNIYQFNIERGIQTLKQIEDEGISAYAGVDPCNQVACGMYVTLSGVVLRCPGDDKTVFGNVFHEPLKAIWEMSENRERAGTFNCRCPPKDGKTIPFALYPQVLDNLKQDDGNS